MEIPSRPVVCNILGGQRLIVNPGEDAYQRAIFLDGVYEPGTLHLMKNVLRPGDVFVDVGANLGMMTVYGASLVAKAGTVLSFEPSPSVCRRLRQNVTLNACTNVEIYEIALGAEPGKAAIYKFPSGNIGANSLMYSSGRIQEAEVTVARLEDYIEPRLRNGIRFMKIDVEGYECHVLRGSLKLLTIQPRPILCVEYGCESHGNPSAEASHRRFINSLGGYQSFVFNMTKFSVSKLVPWSNEMPLNAFENIIYIPEEVISSLPKCLFKHVTIAKVRMERQHRIQPSSSDCA